MYYTKNEEHLYSNVTAYGTAADKWPMVTVLIMADKADVVRHCDCDIESCQKD